MPHAESLERNQADESVRTQRHDDQNEDDDDFATSVLGFIMVAANPKYVSQSCSILFLAHNFLAVKMAIFCFKLFAGHSLRAYMVSSCLRYR